MVNASPITDPLPITRKFHFSICRRLTAADCRQELGAICCEPAVKVMVRFCYNLLIPTDSTSVLRQNVTRDSYSLFYLSYLWLY